jgi:alpha,alpha-trehalase
MRFEQSALFIAVQKSELFSDSKTFADAIPKHSWQQAIDAFDIQQPTDLRSFVEKHFDFASSPELQPLPSSLTVKTYIEILWQRLERPKREHGEGSLLPLPDAYIVPGGRFNEIYYWDSYFTALGLIDAGRTDLVVAMLNNFVALINTFGHVPNGNRSYYLSRSQPPVAALMVDLLWSTQAKNIEWLEEVTRALLKEHAFWMKGHEVLSSSRNCHQRVVRMPCGTLLNRYWDDEATPRPESFREDMELASHLTPEQQGRFFRDVRAACESGWDFSARWFEDEHTLETVATTKRVPIDLNGLIYLLEKQIARCLNALGQPTQATQFEQLATKRQKAIQTYCWDCEKRWFMDYHLERQKVTAVESLAATVMLFAEVATEEQAHDMAVKIEHSFLKAGGLVSTLSQTHAQWDSPNGWAPLQWFAVSGLLRYGKQPLAVDIMQKWLTMIENDFAKNQCLLEKYNVCEPGLRASGGEYLVQQGFGWTNGVTQRFYTLIETPPDDILGKI